MPDFELVAAIIYYQAELVRFDANNIPRVCDEEQSFCFPLSPFATPLFYQFLEYLTAPVSFLSLM